MSLLALTDPFNIVPPFVKHLSELKLSEGVESLLHIVCSCRDLSPFANTSLFKHIRIVLS